jgi:hypothetical protein
MDKNLPLPLQAELIDENTKVVNIQTGSGSKQIFTENLNMTSTPTYVMTEQGGNQRQVVLSTEYCSVFVKKDECFSSEVGSFEIFDKRLHFSDRFASLDELFDAQGIAEIKTYPSLFMDTLHGDKKCADPNQQFYHGIVLNVERKTTGVKITYRRLSYTPLYQQSLQDISLKIGIDKDDGQNVLDSTGWFIRKINIRRALMDNNIYL